MSGVGMDPDIIALFDAYARCDAPVGNYYGTPSLVRFQARWYMGIGTSSGSAFVQVSDAFAAAWFAEFDGKRGAAVYVQREMFGAIAAPWPAPEMAAYFDPAEDGADRAARIALLAEALHGDTK